MHNCFQEFSNHSNVTVGTSIVSAVTKFSEQCYNRQDMGELEKWKITLHQLLVHNFEIHAFLKVTAVVQ